MKKITLITLLLLITTAASFSQIEIKFKEFPKGKLNGADLWKFDAKNTGTEDLNTVFTLTVTFNDTLLYESSTKNYPISKGESINVDLKFEEPPLKAWFSNIKKGMIIRENEFLIGDYKICMTAYAANSKNQPDKDKIYGTQCVNHTVENFENDAVLEIKVKQPVKGKLSLTDLWNFTASNKSKSKQIIEVYCKLLFNGEDMLEACSRAFIINPGDIQDYNFQFNQSVWNHFLMEPLRDKILQTGIFPAGQYNLCLTLRSEWTKKEFVSNCIDQTVEEEKKDK